MIGLFNPCTPDKITMQCCLHHPHLVWTVFCQDGQMMECVVCFTWLLKGNVEKKRITRKCVHMYRVSSFCKYI